MARPRRQFERVTGPLGAILARLDPEGRLRAYRAWDVWDDVVGAAIAQRAQPQRLRGATLVVEVSTHTWMQELQFLKDDIRRRLNERLGSPLISDLHFVLGHIRKAKVEKPEPPPPPVAVPELPTTGSPELDDVLRRIAMVAARRRAAAAPPPKTKRRRKT